MRAHPLVAVFAVLVGIVALEIALPVWPEVYAGVNGLDSRGASFVDAMSSDADLARRLGLFDVLRAIAATQYLVLSAMAAAALGACWLSARYLRAREDLANAD